MATVCQPATGSASRGWRTHQLTANASFVHLRWIAKSPKELLKRLRLLLVLNWRQKSAARSALQIAIEDALDAGLPPPYTKELYQKKCAALFEHVFESYPDRNRSVYSDVA